MKQEWSLYKEMGLTDRECEVVEMNQKGYSVGEIAHQMFITKKTVEFHMEKVTKKVKRFKDLKKEKEDSFNYYNRELDRLGTPDTYGVQIVISCNGKKTKTLNLNVESAEALKIFIEKHRLNSLNERILK